jgi:hypothetical protein
VAGGAQCAGSLNRGTEGERLSLLCRSTMERLSSGSRCPKWKDSWCRNAPPTETCAEMHLPLHYEQTRERFERFEGKSAQIIITCRKIVQLYLSGGSSV